MIVYYVSFEVDTDDRAGFDEWYRARTTEAKKEKGCLAFDYLLDPEQPGRGFMVEIWETPRISKRTWPIPGTSRPWPWGR